MPDITMPRLSDTMTAGVLATWHKRVGEQIHVGEVVAEIETDKALMELEAYDDGVLERILVAEGETVPIGTPIGVIGDGATPPADETEPPARPPASPLARRLARERGIDLAAVRGSGPHGRIIRADIEAATPAAAAATVPAAPTAGDAEDVDEVPLPQMQRVAAARLTQSKQEAPHIYLTRAVDVTDLLALRATLNETLVGAGGPKVSV
ncbi:MAG: biotin/lipoyl-containing protein, partial [Pseudonocardia sp.]